MSIGSSNLGGLLGRADEVELLTSLLDGVESAGGALVIRGEPGVGKSRLLSETAALARGRGFTVLSTTGVHSEAHLAFAGLHTAIRRPSWLRPTSPVRAWTRARREARRAGAMRPSPGSGRSYDACCAVKVPD